MDEKFKIIFDEVDRLLAIQEPEKAVTLLNQNISKINNEDYWTKGRAYFWLQLCYKHLMKLNEGLIAGKNAIKYFKKAGDKIQVANVLKDTGSLYEHFGKYDKALLFFDKALKEIEDQKVLQTLGITLAKKGKLLSEINDNFGAEINLLAAEQIINVTDSLMHRLTVNTHLMELYVRLKRYDKATFYSRKAEKILQDLKREKGYLNEVRYSQIQLARSVIAQGKGKTAEAIARLRSFVKFGVKRKTSTS